jgi:hypothetical protein
MGGTLSVVSTQPLPDLTVKSSAPLPSNTQLRPSFAPSVSGAPPSMIEMTPEEIDRYNAREGQKIKQGAEIVGAMAGGEAVPALRGVIGALARMLGVGGGAAVGNVTGQAATTGKVDIGETAKTGGMFAAGQGAGEAFGAGLGALRSSLSRLVYTADGELSPLAKTLLHPTELPEAVLRKVVPPPPTFPGATEPSADAFYEKKAADLMRRDAQQRILDNRARIDAARAAKNAPQPSPFGNATATDVSSTSSLPNPPLPAAGDIPQGNPTPFGQPQLVSKFTPPEPSRIQAPGSPPPPVNRTLVSYDRRLLVEMAKGGDLNALRELIRNPGGIDVATAVPNSKYLLEGNQPTSVYGGPKAANLSDILR